MNTFFLKIFNFFYWLPVSVGNHTDYGGGGGGDYSGGGGGGGGDYGGGGSSGSSSGTDNPLVLIIALGVPALSIVYGLITDKKERKAYEKSVYHAPTIPQDASERVIAAIKEHDLNFSSESFLSWSEQVFCQLQQAWTERDWKKSRPFESEELFNLHKSQLDEYIRNGTINVMENVCVNESWFINYMQEENHEYVTVFMKTRYYDYIIKEDTKKVVKGDKKREYHVNYKLRFMRSLGVKTGDLSNKSTHNCPNCGAPVDVNAAGQCAYCGTVITDGKHDWVLCNLDDCGQE